MLSRVGLLCFRKRSITRETIRTFLSESYNCTDAWNSRLSQSFMKNVKLERFYYDLEQRFSKNGKVSAIDVDIFVNSLKDNNFADEAADLVHKLRLSEETSNALDSTSHALIRNYIETGNLNELLQILNNRLNYGIFLDHYLASYLLDKLIKAEDFRSAAQIASFLMLQEDFDHELSRNLSLYACHNFLKNMESFVTEKSSSDKQETADEEVKVRVKFLRNEFFDDHFDLTDHKKLLGKTLTMLSIFLNEDLQSTYKFLGLVLLEKYDNALNILTQSEPTLCTEIVTKAKEILDGLESPPKNDTFEKLKMKLDALVTNGKLNDTSLDNQLKQLVNNAVSKFETQEIEKQQKIYKEWCELREIKLNEEIERLQKIERIEAIEKLTKDMESEEQKLWFFEKEEEINLQIDSKTVYYPKRWFGKKKKPRVVDEGYVPPEVVQRK